MFGDIPGNAAHRIQELERNRALLSSDLLTLKPEDAKKLVASGAIIETIEENIKNSPWKARNKANPDSFVTMHTSRPHKETLVHSRGKKRPPTVVRRQELGHSDNGLPIETRVKSGDDQGFFQAIIAELKKQQRLEENHKQEQKQDKKKNDLIHMRVRDLIQSGMDEIEREIINAEKEAKNLHLDSLGGQDRLKSLFMTAKKHRGGPIDGKPRRGPEPKADFLGKSGNEGFSINKTYYSKKNQDRNRWIGQGHMSMDCDTQGGPDSQNQTGCKRVNSLENNKELVNSIKGYGINSLNRGKFTNFTEVFCAVMGKRKNIFSAANRVNLRRNFAD